MRNWVEALSGANLVTTSRLQNVLKSQNKSTWTHCWVCVFLSTDLSGRMISKMSKGVITLKGSSSHPDIDAITTCLRVFTDPRDRGNIAMFTLKIGYAVITLMKPRFSEHMLRVYDESINLYPVSLEPSFGKVLPWTSLCMMWDSDTGMAQLWKDGMMSTRKGIARKRVRHAHYLSCPYLQYLLIVETLSSFALK